MTCSGCKRPIVGGTHHWFNEQTLERCHQMCRQFVSVVQPRIVDENGTSREAPSPWRLEVAA